MAVSTSLHEGIPFDRKSFTVAWTPVIVGLLAASSTLLFVPGRLLSVRVPPSVRLAIGASGILVCVWIALLLARRFTRNQPAIKADSDRLVIRIYPTKTVILDRREIERVGPVRQASNRIERFMLGRCVFEIHTTRRGLSALHLLIGSRSVEPPLDEVRELVASWARES